MVLHKCEFFLFGMGNRSKYFYKSGRLIESISGNIIDEWSITFEEIIPEEYMVKIKTTDNKIVHIYENESGVYIDDNGNISIITKGKLNLPSFAGHKYQRELTILHHEILINILDGKPLPNYFVYKKPWYRDSAMMCMVLKLTRNLHLVEDWIINLNEIFDRNNAGNKETDNLGQALYMISLVSNKTHPLVAKIINILGDYTRDNHLIGSTDFANHFVYQTKWLKFGLNSLLMQDDYVIPKIYDKYDVLFWWDYSCEHVAGDIFGKKDNNDYPYLTWAQGHFMGDDEQTLPQNAVYPLTWETNASQADYEGIRILSGELADSKTAAPHTWHSAEMFLYLLEKDDNFELTNKR